MAYSNKDKTEKVIKEVEKNSKGDLIRVTRVESSDDYSVDVRNMYTNDAGETCFTQKGVRFGGEQLTDVVAGILEAMDEDDVDEVLAKIGYEVTQKHDTDSDVAF